MEEDEDNVIRIPHMGLMQLVVEIKRLPKVTSLLILLDSELVIILLVLLKVLMKIPQFTSVFWFTLHVFVICNLLRMTRHKANSKHFLNGPPRHILS